MIHTLEGKLDIFFPFEVNFGGVTFPSVGHAFESARSLEESWVRTCINPNSTKEILYRRHEELEIVPNWNQIKLKLMFDLITQKYSDKKLKAELLDTKGQNIEAGGEDASEFWGKNWAVEPNTGENWLGRIIMEVRSNLRKSN